MERIKIMEVLPTTYFSTLFLQFTYSIGIFFIFWSFNFRSNRGGWIVVSAFGLDALRHGASDVRHPASPTNGKLDP